MILLWYYNCTTHNGIVLVPSTEGTWDDETTFTSNQNDGMVEFSTLCNCALFRICCYICVTAGHRVTFKMPCTDKEVVRVNHLKLSNNAIM